MKYLLDTNIVIAAALGSSPTLRARLESCDEGDLVTSAIVLAEALLGSERGKPPPLPELLLFAEEVPVLPFDRLAAAAYAKLPFERARFDLLIAGHALSLGLTIITDDERGFSALTGVRVENWTR